MGSAIDEEIHTVGTHPADSRRQYDIRKTLDSGFWLEIKIELIEKTQPLFVLWCLAGPGLEEKVTASCVKILLAQDAWQMLDFGYLKTQQVEINKISLSAVISILQ